MPDDEQNEEQFGQLMAQAQDGDGKAYSKLLSELLPILRRLVGARIKDAGKVEDVVQNVMLSIHRNRHTYDPSLPFMPWLSTIAHRRTMDSLRVMYRQKEREVLVDEYPETFSGDEANKAEESALSFIASDSLGRAIEKLPSGQRTAVKLLKLKELSLKEASAVSGMSVSALKVATHRAMKNLRTQMKQGSEQ